MQNDDNTAMAEAVPQPQEPGGAHDYFDLNAAIEALADDLILDKHKKLRQLLRKDAKSKFLTRQLDWSRVDIEDEPINPADYKEQYVGRTEPRRSVLYEATFTNNMHDEGSDITAKFQTTRTTKASCTVTQNQTYAYGFDASCTLKLPHGVVEAKAGFKRDIALGKSASQILETSMAWTVDTDIVVKPQHIATAKLVIEEDESKGAYCFRTKMKGTLRITYLNRKDNNSFVFMVQRPIHKVIQLALENA